MTRWKSRSESFGIRRAHGIAAAPVLIMLGLLIAVTAGCRSAADAWEPREVSREQSEAELTRVLERAEAAADGSAIAIAGRDIWTVAADAALTVHPECVSVVGDGTSSYADAGMGVIAEFEADPHLPADADNWLHVRSYGEPSRAYIDKRRVVLLWLRPGIPHDFAVVATEYVPESGSAADGPEVEWKRTAEIRVSYCYDATGSELANFDRAALPPLDLSNLDGHSAFHEVWLRVRQPGEFLCGESSQPGFDVDGLDENAPEYSGVAEGSDPTPEMLQALEYGGGDSSDFELWYVSARRALFVSLDDREHDPTDVARVVHLWWLGFDAEGIPVWGPEFSGVWYRCDDE